MDTSADSTSYPSSETACKLLAYVFIPINTCDIHYVTSHTANSCQRKQWRQKHL